MLTGYDDEVQLAQSDLTYVGFRLAALDTLCQMDICQGLDDEVDVSFGYLVEVPFLAPVARTNCAAREVSICCCSSRTCHFDW